MNRLFPLLALVLLLVAPATGLAADAADPAAEVLKPLEGSAEPAKKPIYGPIRARDPLVRAEIKLLYQQRHELHEATLATLAKLNEKYRQEPDADLRFALARQMGEAKRTLEVQNCDLSLKIARLNGDTRLVAELERALDQMLHPEKYLQRSRPDPAIERAQMGAIKE